MDITNQCAACGNTNIRFTHTLEHREDKRQISVGIECAVISGGLGTAPTGRERDQTEGTVAHAIREARPVLYHIIHLEAKGKL